MTTFGMPYGDLADTIILVFWMSLIRCSPPQYEDDPKTVAYRLPDQDFMTQTQKDVLAIQVIQTGLLLSPYELGHIIWPAIEISVVACARYSLELGLG